MSGLVLRSLLDASIRIAVVAAAVGLILVALRIRAGGARHTAWTVVLVRHAVDASSLLLHPGHRDSGATVCSARRGAGRACPTRIPGASGRPGDRSVPRGFGGSRTDRDGAFRTVVPASTELAGRRHLPRTCWGSCSFWRDLPPAGLRPTASRAAVKRLSPRSND